jgi:hypothetical protein
MSTTMGIQGGPGEQSKLGQSPGRGGGSFQKITTTGQVLCSIHVPSSTY